MPKCMKTVRLLFWFACHKIGLNLQTFLENMILDNPFFKRNTAFWVGRLLSIELLLSLPHFSSATLPVHFHTLSISLYFQVCYYLFVSNCFPKTVIPKFAFEIWARHMSQRGWRTDWKMVSLLKEGLCRLEVDHIVWIWTYSICYQYEVLTLLSYFIFFDAL